MSKRLILSISAALLVAAVAIGATYAYFTADTTATNVVTIGNVNIQATLMSENGTKTITPGDEFTVRGVTVENKGNNPAYIRLQLRPVNAAEKGNYTKLEVVHSTGGNLAVSSDENGNWYHFKLKIDPGKVETFTGLATLDGSVKASSMTGGVQLQYYVEAIQTDWIGINNGYPEWPNVEIKEYKG